MARLKGVIFGADNVLVRQGTNDFSSDILTEVGRLVRFLHRRGIQTAILTNHRYTLTPEGGAPRPAQDVLQEIWGVPLAWFHAGDGEVPWKQRAEALQHVREQMKWAANETLFIGNSQADMQSAINGGVLLLNAEWFGRQMDYGFICPNPKEIARFIDVFCLREHFWFWRVEQGGLRVYALAPYGTLVTEYKEYSDNFLVAVKNELGDDGDFWGKYLCTSVYFTGLYSSINYITSYPRHRQGEFPQVLVPAMTAFAKCFRANYLPDLIVRHTDAVESKRNRGSVGHGNQLNTIHLRRNPLKRGDERYSASPLRGGRTVLVVDDICTQGYSFEAAKAYIEQTGAEVVCVSLLKTLNRDYETLAPLRLPNGPYQPNAFGVVNGGQVHQYRANIVDSAAPGELLAKLRQYHCWDWPEE